MPPTPRPILLVAGLASAALIVLGVEASVLACRKAEWMAVAFQFCTLLAGVMGVLTAIGRHRASHSLALLCAGGTAVGATVFAFISSEKMRGLGIGASLDGVKALVGGMARDWRTVTPLALGGLLIGLSALVLLLRRPGRSLAYLGRAVLAAAPLAAIAWIALKVKNATPVSAEHPPSGVAGAILGLPNPMPATLAFVGGLAAIFLFSICAHCCIRALEVGVAEPIEDDRPAPNAP